LEGSFLKRDVPYYFWAFFPDGILTGTIFHFIPFPIPLEHARKVLLQPLNFRFSFCRSQRVFSVIARDRGQYCGALSHRWEKNHSKTCRLLGFEEIGSSGYPSSVERRI